MWIKEYTFTSTKQEIELLKTQNADRAKDNIEIRQKYNNLLNHLGLVEWTEAPKDAIPAKTILITKKEQKKRNKNKQQSYVDQETMRRQQYKCYESKFGTVNNQVIGTNKQV